VIIEVWGKQQLDVQGRFLGHVEIDRRRAPKRVGSDVLADADMLS
jgi:hypothetical protein